MATILVADDRPTNRDLLVTLLGYGGHRILEASDGVEALAVVRAERPDLAIVDIVMPVLDGYGFVRQLRQDPSIARTRVIFYTAASVENEARQLAHACGVTHIIAKPAEPQEVVDTVNMALGISSAMPVSPNEEFDRLHLRLLTDTLSQKVDELEAINAELEQRVQARTKELATANAHLQDLNRLKDELLAITSHDLRSPLSVIRMMATLLLQRGITLSTEKREDFLRKVVANTDYLLALVNDLLDLTRVDTGQVQLDPSALRVSDVARQSIEALDFHATTKGIAVHLDVTPGEPLLYADRMKLLQVLNNLLSNAIKFTPADGQVAIIIRSESEGVRVSVADTGLGILSEEVPHLFNRFRPGRTQGTAGEKSTGLGLSIVQQWVKLHGGRIEVESTVNRGSTFTVHLPRNGYHESA